MIYALFEGVLNALRLMLFIALAVAFIFWGAICAAYFAQFLETFFAGGAL